MMTRLRRWLVEPALRQADVDSVEFSLIHRRILQRKALLRWVFEHFYRECRAMDLRYFADCPGRRLELGAGSGIIKTLYPDVITSDIKPLPFVDLVLRAERMPFPEDSLRAVYAVNVFHHLPRPRDVFRELLRVLHPGGGVVFIEPYHGPLARWLFTRLHESERFDQGVPDWEAPAATGPFSGANQALSYVVFTRDRARFEREFPGLAVVLDRPHTHLSYLASGGLNFRQLVPDRLSPLVTATERLLGPLNRWIALQHTIVLRKR
jgi:SAM-dependent methyltransferase